jgi:hypothetical protein
MLSLMLSITCYQIETAHSLKPVVGWPVASQVVFRYETPQWVARSRFRYPIGAIARSRERPAFVSMGPDYRHLPASGNLDRGEGV